MENSAGFAESVAGGEREEKSQEEIATIGAIRNLSQSPI